MAYQFKAGTTSKTAELPTICVVVAYHADKTYSLYNRQGNQLMPINNINPEKWEETTTGMEDILAEKLQCESVVVLKTTAVRNTAGAVNF